jgi:hypothetical protein
MQKFKQHIIFRLLWLFMAVNIFNCSVDTPDTQLDYIAEDLTFNDMESVVEIVLEQVFDLTDAIAENDENDTDDEVGFETNESIEFFYQDNSIHVPKPKIAYFTAISINHVGQFSTQFNANIVPPPPKA